MARENTANPLNIFGAVVVLAVVFGMIWSVNNAPVSEETVEAGVRKLDPEMDPELSSEPDKPRLVLRKPAGWTRPPADESADHDAMFEDEVEAGLLECPKREEAGVVQIDLIFGPAGLQDALFVQPSEGAVSEQVLRCYGAVVWALAWPPFPTEVTFRGTWVLKPASSPPGPLSP